MSPTNTGILRLSSQPTLVPRANWMSSTEPITGYKALTPGKRVLSVNTMIA